MTAQTLHARHSYQRSKVSDWSRIEMLLALFEATLRMMDQGIRLLESVDSGELASCRNKVRRLVLQLISGLRTDADPLSRNLAQIYFGVLRAIDSDDVDQWSHARGLLVPIREAFAAIRPQALAWESTHETSLIPQYSVTAG